MFIKYLICYFVIIFIIVSIYTKSHNSKQKYWYTKIDSKDFIIMLIFFPYFLIKYILTGFIDNFLD